MSTVTAPAPARPATTAHLSFPRLLRSEWIKFWTVRSAAWSLSIFFVVTVALVALISLAVVSSSPNDGPPGPDDVLAPFNVAAQLGQVALVVLAALAITGEYTTGMIRSSLTAAPRRTPVLWAKLLVLTVVFFVVAIVANALGALLQQLFFSDDLPLDLSDPQILRALFGTALYTTTIALLSFAFGALVRHSAAAIAIVLGALLVLPLLFQIPWKPLQEMQPFLPGIAGSTITQTDAQVEAGWDQFPPGVAHLTAWEGYAVLAAYLVVVLVAALVRLKKSDA
ncbi:ABC transporter permease subunit [Cellulomonas sp. PhB150]|uniref:ABC transporter permease subunit n=1 Tax=Cellulomonas sp. PhB150 TaxID=2485188 RepID=UPI000F46C1EE|nr:ABC transporter permease subunit [Cellulomonas sp. PhB150]ROS23001.1 ABC-2 type transport system permease protein [Cellulomonas sp. PhB150]